MRLQIDLVDKKIVKKSLAYDFGRLGFKPHQQAFEFTLENLDYKNPLSISNRRRSCRAKPHAGYTGICRRWAWLRT